MENLFVESYLIVYKEIVGLAIYDRYGEDMMIVEPIEFVFGKDVSKTTKVNVRDFIGVIRSETSKSNREGNNWTTRVLEDWESCDYSFIKTFSSKEMCDCTVDLEKFIEDIFIKCIIQRCIKCGITNQGKYWRKNI